MKLQLQIRFQIDPLFEMNIHVDLQNVENSIAAIWIYSIFVYYVLSGHYFNTLLEQLFFREEAKLNFYRYNIHF